MNIDDVPPGQPLSTVHSQTGQRVKVDIARPMRPARPIRQRPQTSTAQVYHEPRPAARPRTRGSEYEERSFSQTAAMPTYEEDYEPTTYRARREAAPKRTQREEGNTVGRVFDSIALHIRAYVLVAWLLVVLACIAIFWGIPWFESRQSSSKESIPASYTQAVIGYNDSASHPTDFIAENMWGRIVIIEIPGGDIAKAIIYYGPTIYGQNAATMPVSIAITTTSAGTPEMIISAGGSTLPFTYNGNGKFTPQQ